MSQIAAEQLLAEHTPALRNFLGARCRDADLTAEMLQEVAARLVTAAPRLSLNGNARGYLFRIAANVWRDHLRRGRSNPGSPPWPPRPTRDCWSESCAPRSATR
jgi:DNA-directed RNA polymerase specialized sigma24 family protein